MTGPILWTGIACAVVLAAVFAWSLWRGPRVRLHVEARHVPVDDWPDTSERVRAADEGEWQDQALGVVAEHCCDLHNRNCDPPSELCCEDCTEYAHPRYHPPGVTCVAPDLSQKLDVIAEPDRRDAEHMNRTLRLAEGGDET